MIDIRLLRYSNAGPFPPPNDPPGPWTSYNFGNNPDQNGFTETVVGASTSNKVIAGNPANRKVEINPQGGQTLFLTTQSPNLDPAIGVTGEIGLAVSNVTPVEYGGFEFRYLNGVVNWVCSHNMVEVHIPQGFTNPDFTGPIINSQTVEVTSLNNTAQTVFRITINGSRAFNFYRAGALLIGPLNLPFIQKPSQTFMWWGEGG
jgi:hypothetical protein